MLKQLIVCRTFRLVSGLRYSEDTFGTDVTNFLNTETFVAEGTTDEVTTRVTGEYDLAKIQWFI